MFEFEKWNENDILDRFNKRPRERRIGEDLNTPELKRFAIIGVEESIGPRANMGNDGAEFAFEAFCSKFLSMQSNRLLDFKHVRIAGKIKLTTPIDGIVSNDQVNALDHFVASILHDEIGANEIPIVIGGGHNTAFPIIVFSAKRKEKAIDVINLDAHADYRPLEGRHSGNPFSYAFANGSLNQYAVIGLQKRYNSDLTIEGLISDNHFFRFHEDYLDGIYLFQDDVALLKQLKQTDKQVFGLELDLDTIENMPSSAISPSAFTMNDARKYIRSLGATHEVCYLHLPEGAPKDPNEVNKVGKALAFLVSDFIEVKSNFL